MFYAEFLTLTTIYFLALLSPGADFFLIMKHALTHGYQKAWWVCLGIASGNALYIILAYMGHHLLVQFPLVMVVIELGGACFLLYLGVLLLLAGNVRVDTSLHVKQRLTSKLLLQGFFSALLNPKNMLFYFSLLFTIISPEQLLHVKIFYAFWMIGLLLIWDMFVTCIFGNKRALTLLPYLFVMQKMVGALLILFALHQFWAWYAK